MGYKLEILSNKAKTTVHKYKIKNVSIISLNVSVFVMSRKARGFTHSSTFTHTGWWKRQTQEKKTRVSISQVWWCVRINRSDFRKCTSLTQILFLVPFIHQKIVFVCKWYAL